MNTIFGSLDLNIVIRCFQLTTAQPDPRLLALPPFRIKEIKSDYANIVIETMRRNSHLNCLWPLLKVLQILGGCPIQRSENSPCGFKEMSCGVYLAVALSAILLANATHFLSWFYLMFLYDLTFEELFQKVFGLNQGSKMDQHTLRYLSISFIVMSVGIVKGNFNLKHKFIHLMELFQSDDTQSLQYSKIWKKNILYFTIYWWIVFLINALLLTHIAIIELEAELPNG